MTTTQYTLQVYWQHARKYKRQLAIMYPMMILGQLIEEVASPLIISSILTNLAKNNLQALTFGRIWPLLLLIVALEAFATIIWNRIVRILWYVQSSVLRDLTLSIFKHLNTMSYSFFSDRFAGSLVSQASRFSASFERLTDALTWNVFKLCIAFLYTVVVLAPKAPTIVIAIVVIAAIYVPIVWYFRKKQIPYNERSASADTKRTGQLADSMSNILAVKSFSNERYEEARMKLCADDVYERSMDTMRINMRQELTSVSIQKSINIAVIVISITLAINGKIAVGIIYLSLTFSTNILRRLWDLNSTFRQFTRVFGDTSDMAKILQITPEVKDPKVPVPFRALDGAIQFDDVTFWYPERSNNDTLFDKLNLNIQPGEKVGLVGPSGGGKTTITKLLLRFMDIQGGSIKIDGQDIASISQADLRRSITYVPQEPVLFHRTISENISYGNHMAKHESIVRAADRANADKFINSLADGYDTMVGERGVKLSGGQKQRIAIARAMLKNAPILLLDEATSALDSESEALIQDALWKLMQSKTAIVIAHRLSTVQKMDRIIVLDEGKIVEEGTHKQLLKKRGGLYARLWSHQSGGFLQD